MELHLVIVNYSSSQFISLFSRYEGMCRSDEAQQYSCVFPMILCKQLEKPYF